MKIYTRTGDDGETGLLSGPRRLKNNARIEAYGAVDELNALLGLARVEPLPTPVDQLLQTVQNQLFVAGAQLADPENRSPRGMRLDHHHTEQIELEIDRFEKQLPDLKQFIVPGGVRGAATIHCARGACRRAERRLVALAQTEERADLATLLKYLNRLSDLLFVLARLVNADAGVPDTPWAPE